MGVQGFRQFLQGLKGDCESYLRDKKCALEAAGWLVSILMQVTKRDSHRAQQVHRHVAARDFRLSKWVLKQIASAFCEKLKPLLQVCHSVHVVFEGEFEPKRAGRAGQQRAQGRAKASARRDFVKAQVVPDCAVREVMRALLEFPNVFIVVPPSEAEGQV